MWAILSQGTDVGNIGGWVSAGLLGSVLAWLLHKHLPDKDKQIADLIGTFLNEINRARGDAEKLLEIERQQRRELHEQNRGDMLRMATLLSDNTRETTILAHENIAIAQETRALSASIGNLVSKVTKLDINPVL